MKYGFVIDHRKCIGCHACTVACKAENDVPLGAFRTWVKYVEKGSFPNTRRYFTIMRCQHCEDAPCVEICPTSALFKRPDGIVDFDNQRCIGCKACMQACPYDALYIDPRTHTAAKCHYCAHRTERGLLPACVIVCPEKAIIAGDLDDPTSEIAHLVAREQVQIRRPDQGTRPQVFYVGADEAAITPGVAAQPAQYMWAQTGPRGVALEPKGHSRTGGAMPGPISVNGNGTIHVNVGADVVPVDVRSGYNAGTMHARTVYDVAHPKPWGWKVGAYLWTKSIAAGALGVAGALVGVGVAPGLLIGVVAPLVALLFVAFTAGLLIWDLKRPDRVWRLFFSPNLRSWLVIGSYILVLFSLIGGVWLLGGILALPGVPNALAWPGVIAGVLTAGYSAFLFGQAEGRDFWQSPILLWHLLAAAIVGGAASLALIGLVSAGHPAVMSLLAGALEVGVVLHVALACADLLLSHSNKDVATAARLVVAGPMARRFWVGVVLFGGLVPILLLLITSPVALAASALLALVGVWLYEDLWVIAGQSVAMS